MLGFNKIIQVQPGRQVSSSGQSQQHSSRAPLGVNSENSRGYQSTPVKRSLPSGGEDKGHPPTKNQRVDFVTPVRRPFLDAQNAPLKKRSADSRLNDADNDYLRIREKVTVPTVDIPDDSINYSELDVDSFPANQQGLYEDGYDLPNSQGELGSNSNSTSTAVAKSKVGFERVNEETVEMGGFILPGSEKKITHKSYNWIAGRADGQYRVVLGYNTLFKVKNAVDSTTGEKDFNRWRVVRFENRYKENYPYTEFPAKYLEPLIQALEKAREQHALELKEEISSTD